jgi:hypothetical protein
MSGEKDGGPAFPRGPVVATVGEKFVVDAEYGMSLRDWFAGQALASLAPLDHFPTTYQNEKRDQIVARAAYMYADAMLAERSKQW